MIWTPELIARVRTMAVERMSATQIGAILHATRSAVCGLGHRNGIKFLCGRTYREGLRPARARKPYVPKPKIVAADDVAFLATEPEPLGPVGEFPAGKVCKWIHGDPRNEWRCCGHPATKDAWCEHHLQRLYMKNYRKPATAPNWNPKRRAA